MAQRRWGFGGRGPEEGAAGRRSGPPGEKRWWDVEDQAIVEQPLVAMRDLPRHWRPVPMVNNVEVLDPFAGIDRGEDLRRARTQRRLTALDEGLAFRGREARLLVLRTEMFAELDETAHRDAWQADGSAVLVATYRSRWSERQVVANWVDARVRRSPDLPVPLDPRVDWIRIEDHTDPTRQGVVHVYEHLTMWAGRAHVVATVRHLLDQDLDEVAAALAVKVLDRLEASGSRERRR